MSTYTNKHREYYLKNRDRILSLRREREQQWLQTPKGKYSVQKRHAKQRGISWELTFDEWWNLWQQSGKWEERSQTEYVMCRNNDEGPYSIDNVRIDTSSSNAQESYSKRGVDHLGRFK